ncbi:hypothetical protein A2U01_0115005, partial [Trifolium medium]|nr:hypothetical protein [Trifolium medium]
HEDTKITLDLDVSDADSLDDDVHIIVRDDNQKPVVGESIEPPQPELDNGVGFQLGRHCNRYIIIH